MGKIWSRDKTFPVHELIEDKRWKLSARTTILGEWVVSFCRPVEMREFLTRVLRRNYTRSLLSF